MSKDININVHHIARLEGHGNILVDVTNGELREVKLEIVESPRFFEAMLVGRRYPEANHIASRICGICAVAHSLASLRAIEDALGIEPSRQTVELRKIMMEAEQFQSNVLHYYFLVAPDLVGAPSVIPLAASHPEVVKRAIRMKKLGNDVCDTIGGRHTHPISMAVDGFTNLASEEALADLLKQIKECLKTDAAATVDLFAGLKMPQLERKTDYVSLSHPDEYPFYEGMIR